ncbi:MAG TPA: SAM-dependent methyltransferase [Actinospica sp.]|nr:SAM-dependent methyltransferase [Actinospica sp.]
MNAESRDGPWASIIGQPWEPPAIDPDVPHPVRMWDYMIGGKDHYVSDRMAVDYLATLWPDIFLSARAAEAYAERAAAWIAGAELTQFVQLGCAIPLKTPLDGIVHERKPGAPYVYVTDDPITAAHARAVLVARARGPMHVELGEFRDPAPILASARLGELLDFSRPVGVMLIGMLDYTLSAKRARQAVVDIMDALAPGSLVVTLHHLEFPPEIGRAVLGAMGENPAQFTPRSQDEVAALFEGFEFQPPGLVRATEWRPDGRGPGHDLAERCDKLGGVLVKR